MRRSSSIAGAFLGMLFASGAFCDELDSVRAKLRRGGEVRLAAIGDSITFLCGHTDFRRNYLTFVADALRKTYPTATIRVQLSGNRGNSSLGLGFLDALLETRPDAVFIMFGMNDCGGGSARIAEYDRNLAEFVSRVRARGACPIILTQNQIVYDSKDGRGRKPLGDYMRRAALVARRESASVVDNFADWSTLLSTDPDWTLYLHDAIHPNLAGHRRFARKILDQLWPEAAGAHFSGLWPPLPPGLQTATDALLPGPAAAQILRIGESQWLTLTGRRRHGRSSDLVLSLCGNKAKQAWTACAHYTLIGPGPDALYPWLETDINSGMLIAGTDRVYIAFSQTVRNSLLTLDIGKAGWRERLGERASYSAIMDPKAPLPQSLGTSRQANCEILDGVIDESGVPALLVRDYVHGQGSGIGWLAFSAREREYMTSLTWPPGPNPSRGRVAVDFVTNSGIKPDDRPWRYEGQPPAGANSVGLLWEDQGIHFQEVRVPK